MATEPRRPVLRYHGGKWRLAPWVIRHFPAHEIYVEPFAGAASVLMRKSRVHGEVLNDLDGEIVNVFRVLRDKQAAAELERLIRLTPFARSEFELSYQPASDPIEMARRTIARTFMGFGTTSRRHSRTGFRARTYTRNQTGPSDFSNWPDEICVFTERLRGVLIDNKPADEIVPIHDGPNTLFYVDPPYVLSTRTGTSRAKGGAYQHEMSDDDHRRFARILRGVQGMVAISGYRCDLYDELFGDWDRRERLAYTDGAKARTECLWLSPGLAAKLKGNQLQMVGL